MDDEHWYRSLLKSIIDNSEEVNLIYVEPDCFTAKLTLEQVTKLKELPEISYIMPEHFFMWIEEVYEEVLAHLHLGQESQGSASERCEV